MKNVSFVQKKKIQSFNHARIIAIDRIKGRVSLFMRNGLISTGVYLYDLNDLKEGMTVLAGKLDGSYVIIEKVTAGTKKSAAATVPIEFSDRVYGSGGIDVYNGKVYICDHFGCAVKIYDEYTGILLATLDTAMGQPKSSNFYPGDIKIRDGIGYITFPYNEITMSATLTLDGLNMNMATIHYYHSSYTSYPECLALNDDYLFVSSVQGHVVTVYERDVTSHSGDDRWFTDVNSVNRVPLGMYCLDNNRYAQILVAAPLFPTEPGPLDYTFSGAFLYDLSMQSSIMKYGESGVGPTNITAATCVWLYDDLVYVTDGLVSTGPLEYRAITYPKVLVFDYATGELIRTFGSRGTGSGQFICPTGICVYNGIVYVNDISLGKTLRFTTEGLFLGDLT